MIKITFNLDKNITSSFEEIIIMIKVFEMFLNKLNLCNIQIY